MLGCLAQLGWLYGIADIMNNVSKSIPDNSFSSTSNGDNKSCIRNRTERRDTCLLEIGAINTELLDAAKATVTRAPQGTRKIGNEHQQYVVQKKYRLQVRAIDLHSMHDGIEEVDFLSLPVLHSDGTYDVIVCSMVLNCVPTALKRGAMLLRIVYFLKPGGLVYITIPKTCLNLSPYLDASRFTQLLQYIGLTVLEHKKDTPKVAFFVGQKSSGSMDKTTNEWRECRKIRQGRKFRNDFAIVLPDDFLCSLANEKLSHQFIDNVDPKPKPSSIR